MIRASFAALAAVGACAQAMTVTYSFQGPDGIAAEVDFTLTSPTTLQLDIRNTSTGAPAWFDAADQILTTVSFDLGLPGANPADPAITGGTVHIAANGTSVNFSTGSYGPGADVSGEWGYANAHVSPHLPNALSAMINHTTPFAAPNLDGPGNLNGPQGGVVAPSPILDLGGLGAVRTGVVATLTLSAPLTNLSFLANDVVVEFGSDALHLPAPATLGMTLALTALGRRRRA